MAELQREETLGYGGARVEALADYIGVIGRPVSAVEIAFQYVLEGDEVVEFSVVGLLEAVDDFPGLDGEPVGVGAECSLLF